MYQYLDSWNLSPEGFTPYGVACMISHILPTTTFGDPRRKLNTIRRTHLALVHLFLVLGLPLAVFFNCLCKWVQFLQNNWHSWTLALNFQKCAVNTFRSWNLTINKQRRCIGFKKIQPRKWSCQRFHWTSKSRARKYKWSLVALGD